MFDPDPQLDALLRQLQNPNLKKIDPSLERIEKLLAALGNPEKRLSPVVHVAGTNGKGSVIAYLRAILKAAGYRVHSYTSPHLVRFAERIRLDEQEMDKAQLMPLLQRIYDIQAEYPATFFEATTAAAFLAFAEVPADIVLLETGMGGRLDATNVIARPTATVITPIGMDHQEYLGNTLAAVAGEKAAIMKTGVPAIIGPQPSAAQQVIENVAGDRGAVLYREGMEWSFSRQEGEWHYRGGREYRNLPVPALAGEHQFVNAATAIAVIEKLSGFRIGEQHIHRGLQQVQWPARLQLLSTGYWRKQLPASFTLYLDGGHNPMAAQRLAAWLVQQEKPVYLIAGMLRDKDAAGFFSHFRSIDPVIYTVSIPEEPGCFSAVSLAETAQKAGLKATDARSVEDALAAIVPAVPGVVLICGSLYLAGHVLGKN